jgi:hypothetical protein
MLVLLVVVVAVIVIAAALVAVPRAGAHRLLGGRGRGPARHRPVATGRRGRASRAGRHRTTDERVLLAEGEEIQQEVEARLSARGVAPHRLSGPNPPTAAERLSPQILADERHARLPNPGIRADRAPGAGGRRYARPPLDSELPETPAPVVAPSGAVLYGAPGTGLPPGVYAEPDPLLPGEPGYDGRLLGRRRGIGSRGSARDLRSWRRRRAAAATEPPPVRDYRD